MLPTIVSIFIRYFNDPSGGLDLDIGITFIGGLIGGVVSFLIIYFWKRNKFKSKLMDVISIAPCVITVAHGFGRVGCFLAGCCYGKTTGTSLDMAFPIWNYDYSKILGYNHYLPTQLYEAIFLFLIFGIMSLLLLKWNFKYNMPVYLISYGVWRFLIEFVRGDDRGSFVGNISPSQFWSIVMVIAGIGLWIGLYFLFKKKAETISKEEA